MCKSRRVERKRNEHNDTLWQSLYRELVENVIVLINELVTNVTNVCYSLANAYNLVPSILPLAWSVINLYLALVKHSVCCSVHKFVAVHICFVSGCMSTCLVDGFQLYICDLEGRGVLNSYILAMFLFYS